MSFVSIFFGVILMMVYGVVFVKDEENFFLGVWLFLKWLCLFVYGVIVVVCVVVFVILGVLCVIDEFLWEDYFFVLGDFLNDYFVKRFWW